MGFDTAGLKAGCSRYRFVTVLAAGVLWAGGPAHPAAETAALPVSGGRPVVATVNDGSIFLDELVMQLDPPVDRARLLEGRATAHELAVLNRLITTRLIALEGATMGLGDLPEIRKQVDVYAREAMREVLLERVTQHVKPDEAAVEAVFRDLAREWKTVSLLFPEESAAASVRGELATGAEYEAVARRAVAELGAKTQDDEAYHRRNEYLPEIAAALASLEIGHWSPVIRLASGFTLLKIVDIRYPENPEFRARARETVLGRQRQEAVQAFEESLRAERVVVHQEVLDALDYEGKEIDELVKDTRVLAGIKGADPVTVGDLTDYMRMQFFHGGQQAGQGKRLNARKAAALDATIGRRLFNAEALRLGIDDADAYLDRVNAFEESLVFGMFVERVIVPDSRLREEDVKEAYERHRADYGSPSMLRLRALAFSERGAAESSVEKLRNGADFRWVAETAEHQVPADAPGLLSFEGRPIAATAMPDGLQKALADAKPGDVRLYASPEGHFYSLVVDEVVPPSTRPYEEVREQIAKKVFGERLTKGVEDYAAKLRALSKVTVHLEKVE